MARERFQAAAYCRQVTRVRLELVRWQLDYANDLSYPRIDALTKQQQERTRQRAIALALVIDLLAHAEDELDELAR